MAMKPCRECGERVSTRAKTCPKCGIKSPTGTSTGTWIVVALLVLVVGTSMLRDNTPAPPPTPPSAEEIAAKEKQAADKARADREMNIVLVGARHLKESMKKPESFELLKAIMIDGTVICYEYRARNSFNDRTAGFYVVTDKGSSDTPAWWNKHCANKSGADYTHVRQLL